MPARKWNLADRKWTVSLNHGDSEQRDQEEVALANQVCLGLYQKLSDLTLPWLEGITADVYRSEYSFGRNFKIILNPKPYPKIKLFVRHVLSFGEHRLVWNHLKPSEPYAVQCPYAVDLDLSLPEADRIVAGLFSAIYTEMVALDWKMSQDRRITKQWLAISERQGGKLVRPVQLPEL